MFTPGYGYWYSESDGGIRNDVNSYDFNGYMMPEAKKSYTFESIFGTKTGSTTGDDIGFSIVYDKDATPKGFITTSGKHFFRNTLFDIYGEGVTTDTHPKRPVQSAWVHNIYGAKAAYVVYTDSPIASGQSETIPEINSQVNLYYIPDINKLGLLTKNDYEQRGTEFVSETHDASGIMNFLKVTVTNSTNYEDGINDIGNNNDMTIKVLVSQYNINTHYFTNSSCIIDGTTGNNELVKYISTLNSSTNGNKPLIKAKTSMKNGILSIDFSAVTEYKDNDNVYILDDEGNRTSTIVSYNEIPYKSKLTINFVDRTYTINGYNNSDSTGVLPSIGNESDTEAFYNSFTQNTKFMYDAYSYENLFIRCLSTSLENKILYVNDNSTKYGFGVWLFDSSTGEYKKSEDLTVQGELQNGSRFTWNDITNKLFYNDGSNVYLVADTYTIGNNIDINNNTISAKGYYYNDDVNVLSFREGENDSENEAIGKYSHAEGYSTTAYGAYSHAEGYLTGATGWGSHAEGLDTKAEGTNSHAEGSGTIASGYISHAEGSVTVAYGTCSHTEGSGTAAYGAYSHAEGILTGATGYASHAEGSGAIGIGAASHAEGISSKAEGQYSHAEGGYTVASGDYSHSEGAGTKSEGDFSHAEGNSSIASGFASHAEGGNRYDNSGTIAINYTTASGEASHAEGGGTKAEGFASHAEGMYTITGATGAHAEGSWTKAYGENSHAEGYLTGATGWASHAEGQGSIASGSYSHAEGYGTIANNNYEHAEGKFNISNINTIHSIGIGTYERDRMNAFEVMQDGKAYLIGAGGYTGTNPQGASTIQDLLNERPLKGDTGPTGPQGPTGPRGADGKDGADGAPGTSGLPIGTVIDWYGTPSYDKVGKDGWVPCGGFCGYSSGAIALSDSQKAEIQKWKTGYGANNITISTKNNEITPGSNYYNYILIESIIVGGNTIPIPNLSNNFVLGAGIPVLSGSIGINPGTVGGEAEVKLTAKQSGLPSHTHSAYITRNMDLSTGSKYPHLNLYENSDSNIPVTVESAGGTDASQAHNNIPPYVALWKLIKVK
jgi:hypothetical protein